VNFSRDGQWVTYVTYPEGNLWRCRIDGREKLQLTSTELSIGAAQWSPDGHQIAIDASDAGSTEQLYVVSADGGAMRRLKVGQYNAINVSWAADGTALAFNDAFEPGQSTVRTVDLKTLNVTDLPDSKGLMSPARSPDGQYLVATTVAGDKLRLFNSGTQTWSDLTTNSIGSFRWSADSKFVYFDNGFSAEQAVYRVRLADQKVEEVASLKDFRRVVTPWTTWFGVTPDGSLLLMRDAGSQEVYALDLEVP
jgi:Tol biopolymer transport system component